MIYIVYKDRDYKHSLWNNQPEAKKQVAVLRDCGFREACYDIINGECETNGEYLV